MAKANDWGLKAKTKAKDHKTVLKVGWVGFNVCLLYTSDAADE